MWVDEPGGRGEAVRRRRSRQRPGGPTVAGGLADERAGAG